jgi:hypothetical protein
MPKEMTLAEIQQQEQDLIKKLESLRGIKQDQIRKNAEKTIREIAVGLEEISQKILSLKEQNIWKWGPEHGQALEAMGLIVDGPKVVAIDEDLVKKLKEVLAGKDPQTLDQVAALVVMKKTTLRLKLPPIVARGDLIVTKDGVSNLYRLKG